MAHVPLKPIGKPRTSVIDDRAFAERREDLARRSAELEAMKAEAMAKIRELEAAERAQQGG